MRVLVNGLPYFSQRIVEDLNEFDSENRYYFLNTYDSKWQALRFLMLLPFAGAVISFNGVSSKSGILEKVLQRKKKLIMQWHGTDVMLAAERQRNGTIYRNYIDHADHLISAPWFREELAGVVSEMEYAPFSYVRETGNDVKYDKVRVLTYMAEGREEFYGWKEIRMLAEALPELPITIVGTSRNEGMPSNVEVLGWVDEQQMMQLLRSHAIYVRLTEHDGKSVAVSQALGVGCEVIWTQAFDHCHVVRKNGEELIAKCRELIGVIEDRGLKPNQEICTFASENLSRDAVLQNYLSILKKHLNA